MNDRLQSAQRIENPSKEDLLRELQDETAMARRQELLKAIWRLERGAAPVARQMSEGAVSPAPQAPVPGRTPLSGAPPAPRGSREIADPRQILAGLNELYAIETFSLASYLRYADPWTSDADRRLNEAIRSIAQRQLEFSERLGSLIVDRRGHVENRSFPSQFTAYNDLALTYLAPLVMEDQEQIVQRIAVLAPQLETDAAAYDLANEVLNAEREHLETLRELIGKTNREPCTSAPAPSQQKRQQDASVATAA